MPSDEATGKIIDDADQASAGASDTTPAFDLTDATNYPTSSLTGSITNSQLTNSSFTLVDTSSTSTQITLGETLKIQGTTNLT